MGEIRISKAQEGASLAETVGHEALIHSLYSFQSGVCKMKNQLSDSPSGNQSLEVAPNSLLRLFLRLPLAVCLADASE